MALLNCCEGKSIARKYSWTVILGGRDMNDEYQCLVETLIQAMEDSFHSSLRLREISKTSQSGWPVPYSTFQ